MNIELAIAIWGAVLSTILGLVKVLENRSKIKIRLTHIYFYEIQEMYITNVGKKPITIQEVGIRVVRNKEEKIQRDPFDAQPIFPDFEKNADNLLPKRLEEGESIKFKFSVDMDEIHEKGRFQSYAKDTSGKEYKTKQVFLYNGKFHYEMGKVTKLSTHQKKEISGVYLCIQKFIEWKDSFRLKTRSFFTRRNFNKITDSKREILASGQLQLAIDQENVKFDKKTTDLFFACQELVNNSVNARQALLLQIEIFDPLLNVIIQEQNPLLINWVLDGEKRGLCMIVNHQPDRILGVVINEYRLLGISDDIYNQVIYEAIDESYTHGVICVTDYSLSSQHIQSEKLKYIRIPIERVHLGVG